MGEDTKARFDAIDARFDALMARMTDQFDRVLDQLTALRADSDDTRGHVLYGLSENLTLSQRITKLENERRKP
jgi:hypothetical protein